MNIVKLLAKLDWFERAGALGKAGIPSHRFEVADRGTGWSGADIEKLLKRHGVKLWDRNFTDKSLSFRVKRVQAGWAEYLLSRNGISILSKPFYARNASYSPGETIPPAKQKRSGGMLTEIFNALWN